MIPGMYDDVRVTDPLFEEGLGYLESKEYHKAIKCYDKALAIKYNYTLAQSNKDVLIKESSKDI